MKSNQCICFLRKLKRFQVDKKIMAHFYQTIIQSAILYNQVCYFGSSRKVDIEQLDEATRTAANIVGTDIAVLSTICGYVAVKKLHRILFDTWHPLNHVLTSQVSRHDSSQWLQCFRTRTNRFQGSFLPTAVRLNSLV